MFLAQLFGLVQPPIGSPQRQTLKNKLAQGCTLITSGKNKNCSDTVDTPSKKINTHHIAKHCRQQMEISSLDCNIDTENVVRFIDAFGCKLDFVKLKFERGMLA
ncbi:MAG: hypothetical protein IPO27_11485 [Bacteroidetes bacterium]|nr:hypothetical protein [Bacteroidota bacterium]